MTISTKTLARNQLDKRFLQLAELKMIQRPMRGWVRAIRDALNIGGAQLSKRLSMSQQGVAELEKSEVAGSVSIKTMQKAAEALDCVFVYAVVPRESLSATVERRARKVVEKQQAYTSHSMMLEDQVSSEEERQAAFDDAVAELVRTSPKTLWD
jgi:predicted DNA-binding mobile mystery protein A